MIWPYRTPGLPDELFVRGAVPMTKCEVRSVTISRLKLADDQIVWDIGAGTGSVSVEAALMIRNGVVYAVEHDPEAVALIEANKSRFGLDNLEVIQGKAPLVLHGLPRPDRIFIGGSGGRLPDILEFCHEVLPENGMLIINCATLETLQTAVHQLTVLGFADMQSTGVAITHLLPSGTYHMFTGANPVYVVSGRKPVKDEE